jgi:4-diphosphocytidyl-2-C-methyl-D-erythritol kinase
VSAPSGATLTLRAPGKLNLGLRVCGRRPDGYHLLESVFVPIDWSDELEVELVDRGTGSAGEPRIELELLDESPGGGVPGDASNLVWRAAAAFCQAAGLGAHLRLRLRKRLPSAAGLGGGSSDAGAALRALAALLPDALPSGELRAVAAALGADVPFFLDPRPALVTGVGECVEPLAGVPPLDLVLANPGVSLATAAVYAAWDELSPALTHPRAGSTMRALSAVSTGVGQGAGGLAKLLVNDLEPAASRLCPSLGPLQERLRRAGALAVGMSGSGATVFGVFSDAASARAALRSAGLGSQARSEPSSWARVARSSGSRE